MPVDLTDDKSTLVQVMAWFRQAPIHYLSQCWPRFISPYGVTRPQWVRSLDSNCVNFKHNLKIDIWSILVNITQERMPKDLVDGKLTFGQWLDNVGQEVITRANIAQIYIYGVTKPSGIISLWWRCAQGVNRIGLPANVFGHRIILNIEAVQGDMNGFCVTMELY